MLKLQLIVGSTRPGRNADRVLRWLEPRSRAQGSFEVETLDLKDWPLPHFQESLATVGDPRHPTYSDPVVKRWNEKLKEADAYLILSPEYNHSLPGVLKNAIDSVFFSFALRHKPVAFAAYSVGVAAGVRAVEHLNQILLEAEAVPVRCQLLIPFLLDAFDAEGRPVSPALDATLTAMLEDLAWLAKPLKAARSEGQLRPSTARIRAALEAK